MKTEGLLSSLIILSFLSAVQIIQRAIIAAIKNKTIQIAPLLLTLFNPLSAKSQHDLHLKIERKERAKL